MATVDVHHCSRIRHTHHHRTPHSATHHAQAEHEAVASLHTVTSLSAHPVCVSVVQGVLHVLVLLCLCPVLERGVGSRPLLVLLLVVVVCVHLTLFACMVLLYALTEAEGFLFNVWCGASSMTAAVLVALKQRYPDSSVLPVSSAAFPPLSRLQVQQLPFLACWASVLLGLLGWVGAKEAPLMLLGVLYSFLYLRFYQRDPDTGAVGDMRSDMAFATLFPDVLGLRGVVNLLVTVPFHALMRAGCFSDAIRSAALLPPQSAVAAPPSASDATALLVGAAAARAVDPQAERRRILAIKAIDEKLAQLAHNHSAQTAQQMHTLDDSGAAESSSASASQTSVDSLDQASLPGEEELQRLEREVTAGMAQRPQPPATAAPQAREVAIHVRPEDSAEAAASTQTAHGLP